LAAVRAGSLDVVGALLTLHEPHLVEVEHQHVVQLLGQLEDTAKDVHLAAVADGGVATSCEGLEISLPNLNLLPRAAGDVVLPQVVKLVVVVVLSAEDVVLVVVGGAGQGCSWLW